MNKRLCLGRRLKRIVDKRNQALIDLLYQCADDDLLVSFRGSEWLGLAPHIEADVPSHQLHRIRWGMRFTSIAFFKSLVKVT